MKPTKRGLSVRLRTSAGDNYLKINLAICAARPILSRMSNTGTTPNSLDYIVENYKEDDGDRYYFLYKVTLYKDNKEVTVVILDTEAEVIKFLSEH